MNDTNKKQLGNILWAIADQLRGAMNADDFRDYMLSFLFLRYLSDNYETAAKKELGPDYSKLPEQQRIAACLTTLDDLITAQSAKLSDLKTHQKGLMQQLFPSENLEEGSEK